MECEYCGQDDADKEISPEKIYKYFVCRYFDRQGNITEKHFFIKDSVLEECIKFLKILRDLEIECLNGEKRTKKLSELSNLTIKLWGDMLEEALDTLDYTDAQKHSDTIKGISRLKRYLKRFKEFELLLYGSDKWYRDTIYHQLWFYFVGEYIFSHLGIMELLLKEKDWYCEPSEEIVGKDKLSDEKVKARYAFFCVIALCHDLGKPLQKIHSINDAIRSMLREYKFLHFSPFKVEFPLTYGKMLDFLIERLSQIGIPDRPDRHKKRLEIKEIDKNYYIKMKDYLHDQPHMQGIFSTALAELNHGMVSCLLLMESFRRFKGGAPYQNWKKVNPRYTLRGTWIQKSYMTAQSILKSIAYHSIESTETYEIELPYFWVCLVDDLIEGYRPTRAGKDFISPSICKVLIKEASLKKIHISYEFTRVADQNNKENTDDKKNEIEIDDDIIHFFVDKLERYYYMLNISNFVFIIEAEMKKEILLKFIYCKKKDQEKCTRLIVRRKGVKLGRSKDIKELLRQDKNNRIKEIKNLFKKERKKPNK